MRWIGDRFPGWGRKGPPADEPQPAEPAQDSDELEEGTAAEASPEANAARRLILLVPDATGPAAYQLHTFPDAASALEFIGFWFPPIQRESLYAFWALHGQPDPDEAPYCDAVVLIRDGSKRDVVYPFSFGNIEAAYDFLRDEVEGGLGLNLTLVYWAVAARIETNMWGTLKLYPPEPPSETLRQTPALEERTHEDPQVVVIAEEVARSVLTPPPAGSEAAALPAIDISRHDTQSKSEETEEKASVDEPVRSTKDKEAAPTVETVEERFPGLGKALNIRRWEEHDEPFEGFGSPTGKF